LGEQLPLPAVEVVAHGLLLRFQPEPRLALALCADPVVSDEPPLHFSLLLHSPLLVVVYSREEVYHKRGVWGVQSGYQTIRREGDPTGLRMLDPVVVPLREPFHATADKSSVCVQRFLQSVHPCCRYAEARLS